MRVKKETFEIVMEDVISSVSDYNFYDYGKALEKEEG